MPETETEEDTRRGEGAPEDENAMDQDVQDHPDDVTEDDTRWFPRRRIVVLIAVVIAVALGLWFGIPYYLYAMSHESTDDAFIEAHIVSISPRVDGQVKQVKVLDNEHVQKGQLLVVIDPAPFQARVAAAQAALQVAEAQKNSAQINTSLTKQTTGAEVNAAKASVQQAQAAVQTANAKVAAAGSGLKQAHANVLIAQATVQQAKAQVTAQQAEAHKAALDLQRYKQVYATHTITEQQYDHAVAAAQAAQAQLKAAQEQQNVTEAQVNQAKAAEQATEDQLHQAQSNVDEAKGALAQAQAQLERAQSAPKQVALTESQVSVVDARIANAKANLMQAQQDLSYTTIVAPMTGKVTRKVVEPGVYVEAGQTLLNIVPDEVWVMANYKETQLTHMQPGQPATIYVDAYPDKTFKGHVDSIQRGTGAAFSLLPPENATGNYIKVVQRVPVKIVFDEQPDLNKYHLAPGLSVVPEVNISGK